MNTESRLLHGHFCSCESIVEVTKRCKMVRAMSEAALNMLGQVMHACWVRDPDERPSFEELKAQLEELWMELRQDDMKRANQVSGLCKCLSL